MEETYSRYQDVFTLLKVLISCTLYSQRSKNIICTSWSRDLYAVMNMYNHHARLCARSYKYIVQQYEQYHVINAGAGDRDLFVCLPRVAGLEHSVTASLRPGFDLHENCGSCLPRHVWFNALCWCFRPHTMFSQKLCSTTGCERF